jgi:hypothetical protein
MNLRIRYKTVCCCPCSLSFVSFLCIIYLHLFFLPLVSLNSILFHSILFYAGAVRVPVPGSLPSSHRSDAPPAEPEGELCLYELFNTQAPSFYTIFLTLDDIDSTECPQ